MPIYAYRCSACGHEKEVLQKMSAAPLSTCPSCHAETFAKQVTAAGFQLKGSGWYATDFKGGSTSSGSSTVSGSSTEAPSAGKQESAAPSTTPCGSACACH